MDKSGFLARLLDVLESDVVPLTRQGVRAGNKIFGAAILLKRNWSLVVAGTNAERESPLWHGEIATIKKLYEMPARKRPAPEECIFVSTHEPCSMCLSAITWAGYDTIYYFFAYEQTRDTFHIPHDLRILKEVFRCEDGNYARDNVYWKSRSIPALLDGCSEPERSELHSRVDELGRVYDELSELYQASKADDDIPLS